MVSSTINGLDDTNDNCQDTRMPSVARDKCGKRHVAVCFTSIVEDSLADDLQCFTSIKKH